MILQALIDGVLSGAIIALGAIGVTFSLSILRFANFAHGDLLSIGAYAALFVVLFVLGGDAPSALARAMNTPVGPFSFGWSIVPALIFAAGMAIAVALIVDRLVLSRLRQRTAEPLTLVFASFGLALILRNLLTLLFGHDPYQFSREIQMAIRLPLPGRVLVMPDQVLVLAITVVVLVLLAWFLQKTRHGLAMRAVAENPVLAGVAGIDITATIRMTWIVSALLAALAGVCFGITVQVRPEIGPNLLLPLFTAAILGGVGSVAGAVIGALTIGVAENLSALVVPGVWRPIVPFVLLLAVLAVRPQGLFGPRGR